MTTKKTRRDFTDEFKREAVVLLRDSGRPLTQAASEPGLEVSCFHLAVQIRGSYEGLLIALPPGHWMRWHAAGPTGLAQHLLRPARNINPRQVAASRRKPKPKTPKG